MQAGKAQYTYVRDQALYPHGISDVRFTPGNADRRRGRTQPATSLAANLLSLDPGYHVTLIVATVQGHDITRELGLHEVDEKRLHVVSFGAEGGTESYIGADTVESYYPLMVEAVLGMWPGLLKVRTALAKLIQCEPIRNPNDGENIPAFPVAPSVAVIDLSIAPAVLDAMCAQLTDLTLECTMLMLWPLSTMCGLWCGAWEPAGDYVGFLRGWIASWQRVKKGPRR